MNPKVWMSWALLLVTAAILPGCNFDVARGEVHHVRFPNEPYDPGRKIAVGGYANVLVVGQPVGEPVSESFEIVSVESDDISIVRPEIDRRRGNGRVRLNGVSTGRTEVEITAREEGGESHDYDIEVRVAPPARMDRFSAGCTEPQRPILIGDRAKLGYVLLDSTGDELLADGLMPFTFEPNDRVEPDLPFGWVNSYGQRVLLNPVLSGEVRVTSIFGDAEARLRFAQVSDVDHMRIEFNGRAPEGYETGSSSLMYGLFLSIDGKETCSYRNFPEQIVKVEIESSQVCFSDSDGTVRLYGEGECTLTFSLPEANGGQGLSETYTVTKL